MTQHLLFLLLYVGVFLPSYSYRQTATTVLSLPLTLLTASSSSASSSGLGLPTHSLSLFIQKMIVDDASSNKQAAATLSAAASAAAGGRCRRGSFIVLEGVDRCGKSTQVQRLVTRLVNLGFAATARRFPDRTTATGQVIDRYLTSSSSSAGGSLSDQAVHLLFSANRWEASSDLVATLRRGTHVVCDRYAASGVAFSAAKGNPAMTPAWCRAPDVGLPAPDAVVFLDMDPAAAARRGGYVSHIIMCLCWMATTACSLIPLSTILFSCPLS